jgi:hypothetical protein
LASASSRSLHPPWAQVGDFLLTASRCHPGQQKPPSTLRRVGGGSPARLFPNFWKLLSLRFQVTKAPLHQSPWLCSSCLLGGKRPKF